MTLSIEKTSVIVCGGGPTGALLSTLLGQAGVDNICLEQEADITTDPRGIALDEDGIRALQSVGIYDAVHSTIGSCMGVFNFVGGAQQDLRAKPFLRHDYTTSEGGTGHVGFICHKQPVMERHLRNAIAATSTSQLRTSCTLTSIEDFGDYVEVTYKDARQGQHRLEAKFLVGADGKKGYTRKHYLEPRGVTMDQASMTNYDETWIALNWEISLPTPKTHPAFPLWRKGFTPQAVYEEFFPSGFRFLCNPNRPAVCGRFGRPEDRLWRFEFVVQPGEDPSTMCETTALERIVYPYLTHAGNRYGLSEDVSYPQDCIRTLRARPFRFAARSCNRWFDNRVVICGDAAHVFPPFGGQGITSGFRDALGLAWRLTLACRPGYKDFENLLHGWSEERKDQLIESLASTVENGRLCTEGGPVLSFLRHTYMWAQQLYPPWRRELEQGPRRFGMTRYRYTPRMTFLPSQHGGKSLPQVYCVSLAQQESKALKDRVMFTDDVIFAPHKKALFQLIVLLKGTQDIRSMMDLGFMSTMSPQLISSKEATIVVEDLTATTPKALSLDQGQSIVRVASANEFANSALCANRPAPKYYDEMRIGRDIPGSKYLIIRKDRFIFDACKSLEELQISLGHLSAVLRLGN